jgi:hypothetical protein
MGGFVMAHEQLVNYSLSVKLQPIEQSLAQEFFCAQFSFF